jgi:hypothetical protein
MKRKLISLLLSLSIFSTVIMPGTTAYAVDGANGDDSGMVINKTATANNDGTYTIQLEAYATGEKIITEVTEDVPTDIVLVLDQSGSMDESMSSYSFREYTDRDNSEFYNLRHNGARNPNLYYPIGDGAYATVSVTIQVGEPTYTQAPESWNNSDRDGTSNYYSNRENLYALVNGEYLKVDVEQQRSSNTRIYIYTLPDGTEIERSRERDTIPDFGSYGPLYVMGVDESKNKYTYTYTDKDGVTQPIGTSTGVNTEPDFTLYERYQSSSTSRLAALKTAVTGFANAVNAKAAGEDGAIGTADDVNHRIAVVGYAYGSQGYDDDPGYTNTEVFIGSTQYRYGTSAQGVYGSAFQDMNTASGQANVNASIGALTANGATYTDLGVEMANGILNANPVENGEKRNRVVIVFTDGAPGWRGYESDVANDAISEADNAKNAGTTVYSVGIFEGADASSAGDANGNNAEQANWFMQNLSSNNGRVQSPSYYLSAADSASLSNIFQQISDNIETGGSSTTLSEETVIKDIIAPEFALPEGVDAASITLETYSYTGENQWAANYDNMGATASVIGDKVDVTGFDFAEYYVGTVTENGNVTYRGDKLVITFDVTPKDGFLGGNNVYTNTSAGVYENGDATEPILTFERPQVNVPIPDVTVTAEDKNVYLLNGLTAEELRSGATAKVGDVELNLDPTVNNYGLEAWQTSGVDISVVIKDANGNEVSTDLTGLREDTTYNVEVRVSPKEEALPTSDGDEAAEQSGNAEAAINVFKPELTYKDGEVYYGDTVPTDFTENLTATKWKHNDVEADTTTMGEAPELALTYTPDATKVKDGKTNTKQDVSVDAEVKIGTTVVTTDTTFLHTDCTGRDCSWNETTLDGTPAFLLHVKTCQLNISKTGGASDEPYVFTVYKDGVEYSEITIVGNSSETIYELPVGNYTIAEDADWSWRYNAADAEIANLTAENPTGNISCHNTKNENYWLNGFSDVVKNIFGNNK